MSQPDGDARNWHLVHRGSGAAGDAASSHRPSFTFTTVYADDDPALLAETYRLRYRVYCVERTFLRAADFPNQLETDEFDRFSRHFATIDDGGRLAGTLRLVTPSVLGLPLFRHCSLYRGEHTLLDPRNRVVEISRLSVARRYRPNMFGDWGALFSLYRAVYQDGRRTGTTHWAMAAESSLVRNLASYGIPFRQVGPEVDYWGPVAPYVLDLAILDRLVVTGGSPKLEGFLDGLEDVHRPRVGESRE